MAKYVTYLSEKGNPFIEGIRPSSTKLYKRITGDGFTYIEPIIDMRRYKYVRSLEEFSDCMLDNEELIIEISNDEVDKVNSENIFADDPQYDRQASIVLGDFEFDGLSSDVKKAFVRKVFLKKHDKEDEYHLKRVTVITDPIEKRRQYLADHYGGFSDLCYEITDSKVAEMFEDSVFELQQVDKYSYVITKVPEKYKDRTRK